MHFTLKELHFLQWLNDFWYFFKKKFEKQILEEKK